MHISQSFDLETQGSDDLLNLPEFCRVSYWTQGLGTYQPIYLYLNALTPNYLLGNPRIGISPNSIMVLKAINQVYQEFTYKFSKHIVIPNLLGLESVSC